MTEMWWLECGGRNAVAGVQMRKWLIGAGFHGAMAVAFGAWAAHGAERLLDEQAITWVRTGSAYQLWHAVALIGIAALSQRLHSRWINLAGGAFGVGALAFSCSLYGLAFAGPYWLVYVTPVGGGLLIFGWIALMAAGLAAGFGRLPERP
jgi:uncharacterized membrane protein YgdD (TMEM256/DUF423 family)